MTPFHTLPLLLFLLTPTLLPAQQPPDARDLVEQLQSPSWRTRERASLKLERLGQEALPALLENRGHPDLEVQERIQRVLKTIGWVSPELRTRMEDWVRRIQEGDDRLFRRLLEVGPGAAPTIRLLLRPEGGRLELKLEVNSRVVRPGAKAICSGRLVNTGTGGLWIRKGRTPSIRRIWKSYRGRQFNISDKPKRLLIARSSGGCNHLLHGSGLSGEYRPLQFYRYLKPGEGIDLTPSQISPQRSGRNRYRALYEVATPDIRIRNPEGAHLSTKLQLWNGKLESKAFLDVLPLFSPRGCGKVEMDLEARLRVEQVDMPASLPIPLTLALRNRGSKGLKVWNFQKGGLAPLWFLILRPDGTVVRSGKVESEGEFTRIVSSGELRKLLPGTELTIRFSLTHSLEPGKYRVMIGFGTFANQTDRLRVWQGELFSGTVQFRVAAPRK